MIKSFKEIIKRYFISGVAVVVPAIITYLVLKFLFQTVDGILQSYLQDLLGFYRAGLGLLTIVLLILVFGILTRNWVGHRIYEAGDRLIARMPLIRPIYSAAKQLLHALTSDSGGSFKDVGLVEYPRKGLYQLCFVARPVEIHAEGKTRSHLTVFVPATPTPVTGMVVVVPAEDIILLDMSIEDGVKFLVSGGVASPSVLKQRMTTE